MALSLQITDPATLAVFPAAYGRIDGNVLTHASNSIPWNCVTLNWYLNKSAADAGATPVRSDNLPLSIITLQTPSSAFIAGLAAQVGAGNIHSPLDALTTALYLIIKLTLYPGAVDV